MSLSFNSRYAGKIHHSGLCSTGSALNVSIPAMRVRYIDDLVKCPRQIRGFNSRYAGKIHLDLAFDKEFSRSFNSRYAGKIHRNTTAQHIAKFRFQFPLCG